MAYLAIARRSPPLPKQAHRDAPMPALADPSFAGSSPLHDGGVAGFVVDSSVLYLCLHGTGLGLYGGRLVSYLAAASTAWYLNAGSPSPTVRRRPAVGALHRHNALARWSTTAATARS